MKSKNGISLIVLVITIVVIIILAAAVILSLGENNPINDAQAANLASTRDNISSAMLTAVGNRLGAYAALGGSNYQLLSSTLTEMDTTKYPAVLTGAKMTGTFHKVGDEDAKTVSGLYKITNWKDLNLSDPKGEWYYSADNGIVYVVYAEKPKWSNNTTDAFILEKVEAATTPAT